MDLVGFLLLLPIIAVIAFAVYCPEAAISIAVLFIGIFVAREIYSVYQVFHKNNPKFDPKGLEDELLSVDVMDGVEFEKYIANLLKSTGYTEVQITKASGDYGADILAKHDGKKYAFQCKRYLKTVSVKPVQEIFTAKQYYKCDVAVVVTNSTFSKNAHALARQTGVVLWDRAILSQKITDVIEARR